MDRDAVTQEEKADPGCLEYLIILGALAAITPIIAIWQTIAKNLAKGNDDNGR